MKKSSLILVGIVLVLVLFFSVSFASASFFSNIFGKITGNAVSTSCSDTDLEQQYPTGKNYFEKGKTTGMDPIVPGATTTKTDKCNPQGSLVENWCRAATVGTIIGGIVGTEIVNCVQRFGGRARCYQGACVDVCGNNITETGENCDDGANGNNTDTCYDNCDRTYCEDGITQNPNGAGYGGRRGIGDEECDDGNFNDADACDNFCRRTYCGDEIWQCSNYDGICEECDSTAPNSHCDTLSMCTCAYGYTPDGAGNCFQVISNLCNNNTICEPDRGEDHDNCPFDCICNDNGHCEPDLGENEFLCPLECNYTCVLGIDPNYNSAFDPGDIMPEQAGLRMGYLQSAQFLSLAQSLGARLYRAEGDPVTLVHFPNYDTARGVLRETYEQEKRRALLGTAFFVAAVIGAYTGQLEVNGDYDCGDGYLLDRTTGLCARTKEVCIDDDGGSSCSWMLNKVSYIAGNAAILPLVINSFVSRQLSRWDLSYDFGSNTVTWERGYNIQSGVLRGCILNVHLDVNPTNPDGSFNSRISLSKPI